ncbi:MAG: ammonium transporter [Burkholderiaceae bacterium]
MAPITVFGQQNPAAPLSPASTAVASSPGSTDNTANNATSSDPANVQLTPPVSSVTAAPQVVPALPAVPEPPLTRPALIDASKISSGDTAWMLSSTALVLLMTIPGLALFYSGMVRKKNVLGTMVHSFATTCVVTVLWVVFGYSLAFTPHTPLIGGFDRIMLDGMDFLKDAGKVAVSHIAPTIPESVFMMFQMTFAIITPALITGAFAERMKFSALLLFIAMWSLLVYVPVAHWVWEPTGWLAARGVLDFAGGTVVHINAGISGIVAALIIGPRIGFGKEPMPPHNLVLTVIGASLLWVGWFGFNAGSAVAADGRAGMAMVTTQLATAVAALAWMFAEWIKRGKPSALGLVSGAVSGLVAITPASGFVGIGGAIVIGAVAGVGCYWAATTLKSKFGYDDSLDVFGVHAVGGIIGALLTGVFAVKNIGGVEGSLATQSVGVIATIVYAGGMTTIILFMINIVVGLRIPEEEELQGLDLAQHGEQVL